MDRCIWYIEERNKPPNTGRSCDWIFSSTSSKTFDLNLSGRRVVVLDGGTGRSKKRRFGRDSRVLIAPRRRTFGRPRIPVVVTGKTCSPRTYSSRNVQAGDPGAKNRSAIFLMSALRLPNEKEEGISTGLIITTPKAISDSIALTRQRRARTRIIRKIAREWS